MFVENNAKVISTRSLSLSLPSYTILFILLYIMLVKCDGCLSGYVYRYLVADGASYKAFRKIREEGLLATIFLLCRLFRHFILT